MKDVAEIRNSLSGIRHSIEYDISPQRPRFSGSIIPASADLWEFDDRTLSDPVVDARDGEDLFRDLDASVGGRGIDALAWYHPFHLSADKWGIYVPITSVHYCAARWFNPRIRLARRASLALNVMINHEVIHHACEYMVAQFELLIRACCWAPARDRLRKARLEWLNDEEALANANSIRQAMASEPRTIVNRIDQALRQSPPGYRDFSQALSDEGFQDHILEVLRHNAGIQAVDLQTGFLDRAFDALVFFPDLDEARASCPVYLIDNSRQFNFPPLSPRLITSIPRIVETNRFLSMLRKLELRRQQEWQQMKRMLANAVPPYPKFKKLKGQLNGFWGLYLSDGFRVHIRPAANGIWEAVEIGSHTAMGHG